MPPERREEPGSHGLPDSDPDRLRIAELIPSLGEPVAAAGNRPVWLADPGSLWLIERGALDIFLVEVRDGMPEAPFRHVLRLPPGRFAFGASTAGELRLLARGLPGTVLRRIAATELVAACEDDGPGRVLAEDADDWVADLQAVSVPAGPINDLKDVFNDPQVQHREMLREMPHPTLGTIQQTGLPIKFSKTPGELEKHPPLLGEHNRQILNDLGYSESDIDQMATAGVI